MVIAKRELYFLIGVVVVGVAAVVYMYVIDPYFSTNDTISTGQVKLNTDRQEDIEMFQELRAKLPEWNKMKGNGLLDNPELVESQTIGAILAWSEVAAVEVKGTRTGKPTKEGNFVIITYDFNLEGSMASLSKLLWALENSPIPLRISDLSVVPVHEGVDDLNARMQVSALSRAPTQDNPPARTLSSSADAHPGT